MEHLKLWYDVDWIVSSIVFGSLILASSKLVRTIIVETFRHPGQVTRIVLQGGWIQVQGRDEGKPEQ